MGILRNIVFIGGVEALIIYPMLTALAYFYSAPPVRLKGRPLLDLISHGLFFGNLLYHYGLAVYGVSNWLNERILAMSLSIFIYSIILNLRNHIEDYEVDLRVGVKTAVVWYREAFVIEDALTSTLSTCHCISINHQHSSQTYTFTFSLPYTHNVLINCEQANEYGL